LIFFKRSNLYRIPPSDDPRTWAAKHDDTYQRRRHLVEDLHRRWYANGYPWDLGAVLLVIRQAKREMIHSRPHGLAYRYGAGYVRKKHDLQARALKLDRKLYGEDWKPPMRFRAEKMQLPEGRPGQPWITQAMRKLLKAGVWRLEDRAAWLRAYGLIPLPAQK
jgi:hypothetical protein